MSIDLHFVPKQWEAKVRCFSNRMLVVKQVVPHTARGL